MKDPNLPLLEAAARLLQPLFDELVFVGGCATGLLITDPAAGGVRPTKDVDTITEVASYAEYVTLSEKLRALNLTEDNREGAPTCRWRYLDLTIDVMPTDEKILGFSNRGYAPAITSAQPIDIAGVRIRLEPSLTHESAQKRARDAQSRVRNQLSYVDRSVTEKRNAAKEPTEPTRLTIRLIVRFLSVSWCGQAPISA